MNPAHDGRPAANGFPLSRRAIRTREQPISWLMAQAVRNPDVISLAAGLVDYDSLPDKAALRACHAVLGNRRTARLALQYGTTDGLLALKRAVLDRFLRSDGRALRRGALTERHVVVTSGSQQLLCLAADTTLDPGDIVLLDDPSYFVFMGCIESVGARGIGIPVDGEGMRVDLLERRLASLDREGLGRRVKLVYVVTYYENPTGLCLSPARRRALFRLAERRARTRPLYVLEDAAYRALRYDGPDTPSIKSLDRENRLVVYADTFSKPFSPGLRTGFGFLPEALVDPILRLKGNWDFGSANLNQYVLLQALKSGDYDRHVGRLRRAYRRKRNAMAQSLEAHMPPGVRWRKSGGGLYIWLVLPAGVDTGPQSPLFRRSMERGVLYVPGEYCFADGRSAPKPENGIRLSFGEASIPKIRDGVRRLAACIREIAAGRGRPQSTSTPTSATAPV